MEKAVALKKGSVFDGVTPYHWLVVIIASCGWLFDCMDQRIFILARESAFKELLAGDAEALGAIKQYIGWATMWMMLGWGTGGIIFGMSADKIGRVKTMIITLIIYTGFTGLSGIAHSCTAFMAYRFLVGLGVGGMFGSATSLVAESVPGQFRALALGSLQALSATGNIMGSLISYYIQPGAEDFLFGMNGWRCLFFVGIIPAILIVPIITVLKEPEAWKQAKAKAKSGNAADEMGSIPDLFRDSRWRHRTIVGVCLGVSGMIGLWAVGFYSPELITTALKGETQEVIDKVRSLGTALQDVGAFFGMMCFTLVAAFISRRLAFFCSFVLCLLATIFVFNSLNEKTDAYWMLPIMGFTQLAVFAGYSIYFPELFPTRLRGTGVGFCYNATRFITAPAPWIVGYLSDGLESLGYENPFRAAATIMAFVYCLGMVALIWAPETKDEQMPDEG